MSLGTFFSHEAANLADVWKNVTSQPLFRNLQADAESFFHNLIGVLPWNTMKQEVVNVVSASLGTVEAHNQLLALAASFVPGGNLALANMVASGAISTVQGILQKIPVPTAATSPTPQMPAAVSAPAPSVPAPAPVALRQMPPPGELAAAPGS